MARSRLYSLLMVGWFGFTTHAAGPPVIRYEGYKSRYIRLYFEYAGNGRDTFVQPPPLPLKEEEIALGFIGSDETGRVLREWVRPNHHFLGHYLTTEMRDGQRYALLKPPDPYASQVRIPLHEERSITMEIGYFSQDDRGDSLAGVFPNETLEIGGRTYLLKSLHKLEAILRSEGGGDDLVLPLTSTGLLRSETFELRHAADLLRKKSYNIGYQLDLYPKIFFIVAVGAFGFLSAYVAIFIGLTTLEPFRQPRDRSKPVSRP